MLKNLIGYEFRATRRVFLPAYLVLVVLSVLNGISLGLSWNRDTLSLPTGLLIAVYVAVMMAVVGISLAYMIVRYYRNLLGDEGYLMFTLPVRPSQLLWSKAIVSTVWMMITTILCCISVFLIMTPVMIAGDITLVQIWSDIQWTISNAIAHYGASVCLVPFEVIIACIFGVLAFCMQVYAALSLGQLANRYRMGWSFAAYIGFSVVEQIIVSFATNILGNTIGEITYGFSTIVQIHCGIGLIALWTIVEIVVYFLISNYLLNNKLNLQ